MRCGKVMLKAELFCTPVLNQISEKVLAEVEKNSFIALPGKMGNSRLMPSKHVSQLGKDSEKFYSNCPRGCDQLLDILLIG